MLLELDLLYKALESPMGIALRSSSRVESLKRLYQARRGDAKLETLRLLSIGKDEIWIIPTTIQIPDHTES